MTQVIVDEALLREPRLWVPGKKPVGPVKVDTSHPLADKLAGLVLPTQHKPRNIVTGNRFSTVKGSPTIDAYPDGLAAAVDAANDAYEDPSPGITGTKLTLFWHGMWVATPNNDGGIFLLTHSNNSATAPYVVISIKNSTSPLNSIAWQANTGGTLRSGTYGFSIQLNKPYTIVLTVENGDQRLFVNGKWVVQGFYTGDPAYGTGPRLVIGEDYGSSRNGGTCCYMGGISERIWTNAEVESFSRNPYQFLIPA